MVQRDDMKLSSISAAPIDSPKFHRPSMLEALGEFRVPLEATMLWLNALTYSWPRAVPGQGKTIMFIPGFMAGDITLAPMANFCRFLGHRSVMAGIWSNSSCPREVLELVGARIERVVERHGGPVVVIGHSLGGIYAREIGRRYPDAVERVITMGSPITRPRDAANRAVQAVASSMAALRGRAQGCLSENCSCGLTISNLAPPRVPTTVIYSRTDGIVHWQSCLDLSRSPIVENIEVHCSHVGMAVSAEVYKIIAARLILPETEEHERSRLHLHPGAESAI
ncbi:MAG: alpha/beta fold hydrolase [Candidatus Binataceae bacterium]